MVFESFEKTFLIVGRKNLEYLSFQILQAAYVIREGDESIKEFKREQRTSGRELNAFLLRK